MVIFNKEYIENYYNKNNFCIQEISSNTSLNIVCIGTIIGTIVYELLKDKKNKKKDNDDKKMEEFYKNHPLVKEAANDLKKFGNNFVNMSIKEIKDYARNNAKYSLNINDIKRIYNNQDTGFDIQIISLDDLSDAAYEKWYNDFLNHSIRIVKDTFNKLNSDDKYNIKINSGDGDEGMIFITIILSNKAESELRNRVQNDYNKQK